VEIDLLLQGEPPLGFSREGLPPWKYSVTVERSAYPERYEIYTANLEKRLPRFRIPLAANDRDTVLDLQVAFARCYEEGRYSERIDYSRDPVVPLSDEDRNCLNALLSNKRQRPE